MSMDEGSNERRANPRICTVLGGRCPVGRSLVSRLLKSSKEDNWIVRIADSDPSLFLDPDEQNSILSEAIASNRASYFHFDVREKSQICEAIKGSSVVFHMDSLDTSERDFYVHYMATVQGTKNVISACQDCKVERLIYNSSADVVFDGIHDVRNGDESMPYAWRFEDMLNDFKVQAEKLVLFANGRDGLLTCALRPSNVFGPGETQFLSFLVGEAKSGRAKLIIGNGENKCDFTYVENVAHAHVCAERALHSGSASVAGKAFFITNLEPIEMWEFVTVVLEGLGYPRPKFRLPVKMVLFIVVLLYWILEKSGSHETAYPRLSRAMVYLLSCTRTFNCSNAQKHIGYSPIVSLEDGVALTIESLSHLPEDLPDTVYREYQQTKADELLGSGRVADILLWREEKKTFGCFLALVFLFYWFFLSGRNLISSTAQLLFLASVILFGQGFLPPTIYGYTVQKISLTDFELSKTLLEDAFRSVATTWNNEVLGTVRTLAQGDDWNFFFKVAGSIYFLKLLITYYFNLLFGVGLVGMFTAFITYEQHEAEVDVLIARLNAGLSIALKRLKILMITKLPVSVIQFLHDNQILDLDDGPSQKQQQFQSHE
ncbi:hypothetical protein MRB53_004340 [Persea americana]|uniref:Uncharacterized protein n=1 Tax=Persea americana TaxID=3435 RepID=A0ACC2MAB4_PERAE|nr:hypothetical protein MRB53_004340 [Persea americana]